MIIPSLILRQLYTHGSLKNTGEGIRFQIKNRLTDVTLTSINHIKINGIDIPRDRILLKLEDGSDLPPDKISEDNPLKFPLRNLVDIHLHIGELEDGKHRVEVGFKAVSYGNLTVKVEDSLSREESKRVKIPNSKDNDYSDEAVKMRQDFLEKHSGEELNHINQYSFSPGITKGNIENFTGVTQVPLGFAGPLHVNGEHANGEFVIPLATTEGTLVASYNRGIKALNASGGVMSTVMADCMQRAPVFIFNNARDARGFVEWIHENMDTIREEAEATTSVGKLLFIDPYLSNRFVYLRFNYSTGDAAGQNMVGRATFAACSWILDQHDNIERFYLESNFATDKKASQVNVMRTRGKRVTAEAVVKRDVLIQQLRVEPESLHYHAQVATLGAFISGANNNGAHSPNAITAMFIATGQDVANVSESSAGILYSEITPEKDLYISLTIPSLIVATYGGGTGLPTQKECLNVMGCYGKGKVKKFAEIVAGVALAGELSLGAAISSFDWVSSHEQYGRNR